MTKPYEIILPSDTGPLLTRRTHVEVNGARLPGLLGLSTIPGSGGRKVVLLEIDADLFEVRHDIEVRKANPSA